MQQMCITGLFVQGIIFSPGYKRLTWLHKRAFKEIILYFQDNKMMINESNNE